MPNWLVKRVTFGLLSPILAMSLIGQLSLPAFAPAQAFAATDGKAGAVRDERAATGRAQAGPATKNVLLLFSGRFIAPLSIAVDEAVRATFQRSPSVKVELYAETLDVARFDPERYGPLLAAYLRGKFADRKLDLIITSLPQAPRFLLKFRKELFPDTPIVYCLTDESELAALTPAPNVTGVPLRIPWKETLDLALGIHPDTRHVVVIAGTDGLARFYLRQSQQVFRHYENRLAFTYLTDRTLPQLLKEVASLPPRTVIIYTTFAVDSAGQVYIDAEVSGIVAKAANAPVYSINNTFMGRGITGGHIIDNGAHATRATEIGLRILAGEKPEAIVVGGVPSPPRFDERQLKRWKIAESRLPAGSIVLYKIPSIWKQYRLLILILGVCFLEALLILALLVHRRRRRLAEESLRQKTEELDQFFNVTLDLLCIANTDGYFLHLNPAWERTLGYTHEELMAKRFLEFVHPDDLDRTRETVSTLATQQKVLSFENRYRCEDGTYRRLEWSSAPAGKLIYAAARDITERKQMLEKIQKAAEEWQSTFDSVKDLVIILDGEFKILRVNAASLSFFELPAEKILGNHCHTLMHGTREPIETCPLAKMMMTKRHEETELHDEKRDAWFHVFVDPIFDEKREITRVVHTVKDVSDRKRVEAEASRTRTELLHVERSARLGELTASLAHELNQPLAAILSNAQAGLRFLQSDKPDLNELGEILQDISSDDKRAGGVIRSLRAMMKQEERERESLSINEIVSEVVSLFHSEAVLRNVIIETDFAESLPTLLADKIQLQQVALNLIMNAAEAMDHEAPERRKFFLKTRRTDHGAIQVAIRDWGPGIEEEKLDRVFQSFFTTKSAGLGMGLSISRSIIEAHGGQIWAENNRDKGATFFFEIPVKSVEYRVSREKTNVLTALSSELDTRHF